MRQEYAETIAIRAIAWLAGNDELLPVFIGATGASVEDLRVRLADSDFLGSVLDFLMMNDAWVVEFCDSTDLQYDQIMQARQALPGGAQVNWT